METIQGWIVSYGYVSIVFLLMLGIVGAPFPDDLILLFAGYLVSVGYMKLEPTIASAWVGSLLGISCSYGVGRFFGFPIVDRYGYLIRVTSKRFDQFSCWYNRLGKWGLLFGYFIAGVRHWTAFLAGMSKLRMPVFALFAYTGGLLWSVTMVSTGYILGERWSSGDGLSIYETILFLVIGLVIVTIYLLKNLFKSDCASPFSWLSRQ
ncbi:MAG: DedA family protein [Desulfomonilaceae bacterium]